MCSSPSAVHPGRGINNTSHPLPFARAVENSLFVWPLGLFCSAAAPKGRCDGTQAAPPCVEDPWGPCSRQSAVKERNLGEPDARTLCRLFPSPKPHLLSDFPRGGQAFLPPGFTCSRRAWCRLSLDCQYRRVERCGLGM